MPNITLTDNQILSIKDMLLLFKCQKYRELFIKFVHTNFLTKTLWEELETYGKAEDDRFIVRMLRYNNFYKASKADFKDDILANDFEYLVKEEFSSIDKRLVIWLNNNFVRETLETIKVKANILSHMKEIDVSSLIDAISTFINKAPSYIVEAKKYIDEMHEIDKSIEELNKALSTLVSTVSINSAATTSPVLQSNNTVKKTTNNISLSTWTDEQLGQHLSSISNKFLTSITKRVAQELCKRHSVIIPYAFTAKHKDQKSNTYWINVATKRFSNDLWILLNDWENKTLYAFMVDANKISPVNLADHTKGNTALKDLVIDADTFIDKRSRIDFKPYLKATITYTTSP